MIFERLTLIKNLLSEDGLIYVHCDHRLNSSIRIILEEIFGKDNFINEIIWKRTNNPKGSQYEDTKFGIATDTILLFSKSQNYFLDLDKVKRKLTEDELADKYNQKDEKGFFILVQYCVQNLWAQDQH